MLDVYVVVEPWLIGVGAPLIGLLICWEFQLALTGSRRAGQLLGLSGRARAAAEKRAWPRYVLARAELDAVGLAGDLGSPDQSEQPELSADVHDGQPERRRDLLLDELVSWNLAERGQFWATAPTLLLVIPVLTLGCGVTLMAVRAGVPEVALKWALAPAMALTAATLLFLRLDSLSLCRGHSEARLLTAAADMLMACRTYRDSPSSAAARRLVLRKKRLNEALLGYGHFGPHRSAADRRAYDGQTVAMAAKIESALHDVKRDRRLLPALTLHIVHMMAVLLEGEPLAMVGRQEGEEAEGAYRVRNELGRVLVAGAAALVIGIGLLKILQWVELDTASYIFVTPVIVLLMRAPYTFLGQTAPDLPSLSERAGQDGGAAPAGRTAGATSGVGGQQGVAQAPDGGAGAAPPSDCQCRVPA